MSDTPQTDQAEASALEVGQWHLAKLCRQLERENAALNKTTKKHVTAYYELMAENAALRIERNRYRATLEDIAELAGVWSSDKARAALGKEDKP